MQHSPTLFYLILLKVMIWDTVVLCSLDPLWFSLKWDSMTPFIRFSIIGLYIFAMIHVIRLMLMVVGFHQSEVADLQDDAVKVHSSTTE